MNEIKLKPRELKIAIHDAMKAGVVPIVLSSPGMGKSHIVAQVARDLGMVLVDERASTMDLTDWRGIPDIDRDLQRTKWYPPDFLPVDGCEPTMVFFDEITQTPPQCQPPLYQLLLEGRLGTVYRKPENVWFVAAGNLQGDGTFVQKIGAALRDRMVALHLESDLGEWCEWAEDHALHPVVIAFLRFRQELLYAFDPNQWASPTLRGWHQVSDILQATSGDKRVLNALVQGKVGHAAAVEFAAFMRTFESLPDPDLFIENPDKFPIFDSKPELKYAMSSALSYRANVGNVKKVIIAVERLGPEYAAFALRSAAKRDPKLNSVQAYTEWLRDHADILAA